MMQKNKPGYILLLSLLMLSILVIVSSRLFFKAAAYNAFSSTIIESQKAKQLALSGLQLAISRISVPPVEEADVKKNKDKEDALEQALEEKFLLKVFPIINLWQEYKLTEERDSLDATIKYVIACESGKMNLNKVYLVNQYLVKKKSGTAELSEKLLEELATFTSGLKDYLQGDYLSVLQEDFNERKYPYNDVSELLEIKQFDTYFKKRLFLSEQLEDAEGIKQIFLTDLFTVFTNSFMLQPFLLSHSVIQMLGLKPSKDPKERLDALEAALKTEPPPEGTKKEDQLRLEWNNLYRPVFGVEFEELPNNASKFLDPGLMPVAFSVTSYATVGKVTKKLYAILQIRIIGDNELTFDIVKLYWIN